jgi:hypothetical protein
MNERWRETFLAFSKLEEHKKRVEEAKSIVQCRWCPNVEV